MAPVREISLAEKAYLAALGEQHHGDSLHFLRPAIEARALIQKILEVEAGPLMLKKIWDDGEFVYFETPEGILLFHENGKLIVRGVNGESIEVARLADLGACIPLAFALEASKPDPGWGVEPKKDKTPLNLRGRQRMNRVTLHP